MSTRVNSSTWPALVLVGLRAPLAITSIFPCLGVKTVSSRSASLKSRRLRMMASVRNARSVRATRLRSQTPRVESMRQQRVNGGIEVQDTFQIGQNDANAGREFVQHLATHAAGRSAIARDHGNRHKVALAFADGLGQRRTLRADRPRVGGILDVTATVSRSIRGQKRRAYHVVRIGSIGETA